MRTRFRNPRGPYGATHKIALNRIKQNENSIPESTNYFPSATVVRNGTNALFPTAAFIPSLIASRFAKDAPRGFSVSERACCGKRGASVNAARLRYKCGVRRVATRRNDRTSTSTKWRAKRCAISTSSNFARMSWPAAELSVALLFFLFATPSASAQSSRKDDIVFGPDGHPSGNATVTVCQFSASGSPCASLATIYSDATGSVPSQKPFQSDGIGNYHFYAPVGRYMIQISAPQILGRRLLPM
jgi:hypothetical protein